MYAYNWAIEVYEDFAMTHPRVGQIDLILAQAAQKEGKILTTRAVRFALIASLRCKGKGKFWERYKSVVKRRSKVPSPADIAFLWEAALEWLRWDDDDRAQPELFPVTPIHPYSIDMKTQRVPR